MGKKRIIKVKKQESKVVTKAVSRGSKRKIEHGILHINSTYNNTTLLLTDDNGGAVLWSSSGSLGFKGAKKGTPFAAGKVAEQLADKAIAAGLKEIDIVIRGVGSGRESSVRSFISKGVAISSIKDETPIPFNGPKPKKPRRI